MPEHVGMHEQGPKHPEAIGESAAVERHLEHLEEERQQAEKAHQAKDIDKLTEQAREEAKRGVEMANPDAQPEPSAGTISLGTTRSMKKDAYKREMARVQKQLPASERLFSKFIHQSAVDNVSEFSAKTIARPSGLLGGGLGALIGTLALLMASRHYGITYNYLIIFCCFVGGYALGLLIEALVHLFVRKSS